MRIRSLLAAATLLAPLWVVAATPAQAATTTETQIRNAVFGAMNSQRRANGVAVLHGSATLLLSAQRHNLLMARHNLLSHQLSGEASLGTRITAAGYTWHAVGENIGYTTSMTQSGALALEKAMYNEKAPNDGHRRNILSRSFADVGVSIYLDSAHHKLWMTMDFGHH